MLMFGLRYTNPSVNLWFRIDGKWRLVVIGRLEGRGGRRERTTKRERAAGREEGDYTGEGD